MDKTQLLLKKYVDCASNLAENVKRNVQHEGKIDNKTVLSLNEFIIAANSIAHLPWDFEDNENDTKLN